MNFLLALIVGLIGFQQGPKPYHPKLNSDGTGPAGLPPRAIEPKFHDAKEPDWSFSKLEQTRDDFRKIRLSLEAELGPMVSENFIGMSRAQAAYADYLRGKRQTDAFRALYLSAEANSGEFAKYDSLWAVLPKDEYEVARLHFIIGSNSASNVLAPMATGC